MKRTLITLLALLPALVGARAEECADSLPGAKKDAHVFYKLERRKSDGSTVIVKDTIFYAQDKNFSMKNFNRAIREAEERMKQADERIREAEKWLDDHEAIDLPKDQRPLVDLSLIKGRWGFEDYYFSGDILHAQARRCGDFYINGWNIRTLLPRLSGLLVLKSKKKVAEKIIFSRETQLRNDKRFQPIVRDRGITIYGHHAKEGLLDEVIILLPRDQSPRREHVCIVQMMGLLRPEDLTAYRQLCEPSPKPSKAKR